MPRFFKWLLPLSVKSSASGWCGLHILQSFVVLHHGRRHFAINEASSDCERLKSISNDADDSIASSNYKIINELDVMWKESVVD
jgi:hypothetical protein